MLQGIVFVDRQRKRGVPEVNANMARAMREREPVLLVRGGDDQRRQSPAAISIVALRGDSAADAPRRRAEYRGAVVQPVFLHYSRVAGLPVARADRPIVAWYGDMTFLPHLWRLLRAGGRLAKSIYGDPIPARASADRKLLARETERAVRRLAERARARPAAARLLLFLPSPKTR